MEPQPIVLVGVVAAVAALFALSIWWDERCEDDVTKTARQDERYRGVRYTPEMWRGMARGVKLGILKRVRKVKG